MSSSSTASSPVPAPSNPGFVSRMSQSDQDLLSGALRDLPPARAVSFEQECETLAKLPLGMLVDLVHKLPPGANQLKASHAAAIKLKDPVVADRYAKAVMRGKQLHDPRLSTAYLNSPGYIKRAPKHYIMHGSVPVPRYKTPPMMDLSDDVDSDEEDIQLLEEYYQID